MGTNGIRRAGLLAVAGGLAAAIVLAGKRLASRGQSARGAGADETYRCDCGAAYRVRGADRHRVYWRDGAPDSDPVLGDRCVQCDAPLPSGHEAATV
jgi:hypothetical protein